MTTFMDKLNLRPQERRLVVVVGVVVFVVLNLWFVRPHFGDWKKMKDSLENARKLRNEYIKKINMDSAPGGFQQQLAELEKEGDSVVSMDAAQDNDIQLQRTIMAQANESKVMVNNQSPVTVTRGPGQTNDFFEEKSTRITVDAEEKSLVDFLYKLGDDTSMIRVREFDLKPADANRYRLRGTLTLSANYQKKTAVKTPLATPNAAGKAASASSPKK